MIIIRIKTNELRGNRPVYCNKFVLCSLFFILCSFNILPQDSISVAKDLTEEKDLKFQQFFFNALSQKSIGNYKKAIENLESCNEVLNNNVSVFFEFSKNYLYLNQTLLAKEYIKSALTKEPNNIWMLKHLVKIYVKDTNYSEAIIVQQKIAKINLKEKEFLVRLYIRNRQYKKAISLMDILEKDNSLTLSLKRLRNNLKKQKEKIEVVNLKKDDLVSLKDKFKEDKSYAILKEILEKSENNIETLLDYSNKGVSLFPAQPYVYLIKGKALNYQKEFKKALKSLKNGLDFVIDNKMEADFYKEIAASYKGLGNFREEKKFIEKSKKIKS